MASRVYIDSSAYLAILLNEPRSGDLLEETKRKVLCSSVMLLIESERNIVRLSRQGVLADTEYDRACERLIRDKELFLLRDVTPDLCLSGLFPAVRTPRSIDLIHLRTARWFAEHGGLAKFITTDAVQLKAAEEIGLPV